MNIGNNSRDNFARQSEQSILLKMKFWEYLEISVESKETYQMIQISIREIILTAVVVSCVAMMVYPVAS